MSQIIENKGRQPVLIAKECAAPAPAFQELSFRFPRIRGRALRGESAAVFTDPRNLLFRRGDFAETIRRISRKVVPPAATLLSRILIDTPELEHVATH